MTVYDCCPFWNENDLYELRLNQHWDFVDKFILTEAGETHTGNKKPFNFDHDRFEKYKSKIIYNKFDSFEEEIKKHPELLDNHSVYDRSANGQYTPDWIRDHFQGNYPMKILKDLDAQDSDIVYFSSIDEILNEEAFTKGINILSDKLRFLGGIRYNIASLYYIFNKKVRSATITIDKVITKKKYLFIMCLNTIHTGKGMKAAPNAKLDDGFFDIIIINAEISKFKLLTLLPKLFTGDHIFSKDVEYLQAKHLEINSDSIDMLNIDGENKYQTPISIDIVPKVLNIFC